MSLFNRNHSINLLQGIWWMYTASILLAMKTECFCLSAFVALQSHTLYTLTVIKTLLLSAFMDIFVKLFFTKVASAKIYFLMCFMHPIRTRDAKLYWYIVQTKNTATVNLRLWVAIKLLASWMECFQYF